MLVRSVRHCCPRASSPRAASRTPSTAGWARRLSSAAAANHRTFSSLPHHLARKNNGMVGVLVRNTKVPRPIAPFPNGVRPNAKPKPTPKSKVQRREKVETLSYAGDAEIPITSELKIVLPEDDVPRGTWPAFRMMDESGDFRPADGSPRRADPPPIIPTSKFDLPGLRSALMLQHPHLAAHFLSSGLLRRAKHAYPDVGSDNTLLRAHRQMTRLRKMDEVLQDAQRQGRISFYMTHRGEEAVHMGSASALSPRDVVFAQYREAGVLMWRGFSLGQFCDQCFSNDGDLGRGRQMPIHYGCRALNYQTVSSPLGTQVAQAVGAAYKLKLDAAAGDGGTEEAAISIAYFGEGAASAVDFHSACNFAATLKCPMIFFCRNNGYAISTPVEEQYAGDGIVSRAPGYGMAGLRVDGNDLFAVHAAVSAARRHALASSSPVLIEAMTYRQGHHSTSDDSARYRDAGEARAAAGGPDPVARLGRFLARRGWTDEEDMASMESEERAAVLRAMEAAEARPGPALETMFEDVYHEKPPHLVRQEEEMRRHLERHGVSPR